MSRIVQLRHIMLHGVYGKTCNFRAHLYFANGEPKMSRGCIIREWVKNRHIFAGYCPPFLL